MYQTIVMPIGIIEEPAPAGATFRLTPQGQRAGLRNGTQVTIWRYHPEQLAMAKYAGRITQISGKTATFSILRAEVDERWPSEINPLDPEPLCTWPKEGHSSRTSPSQPPRLTWTSRRITKNEPHHPGRRRRRPEWKILQTPVLS